jgi:ABC-type multidrug transport system fused ATPase/permease subunit
MLFALFSISTRLTLFSLLVIPISGFVISRIVRKLKAQASLRTGNLRYYDQLPGRSPFW